VHRVLHRRGFSRLRDADRVTAAPVRYVACHPGALLHQDHKKLGRIPDGGGWRIAGRENRPHHGHANAGYEHLEVVIDDASRYAVVVPVPDETSASAIHAIEIAAAEFTRLGIRIERVLTTTAPTTSASSTPPSNAWAPGTSAPDGIDLKTNGKAERLIRTLLDEWAYGRPYTTNRSARTHSRCSSTSTIAAGPTRRSAGASPLDAVNKRLWDHT